MVKKIIPYTGFKGSFAKAITAHFPKHDTYIEPFMGGLGLILNKKPSKTEVINDINNELSNLYEVIKKEPELLQEKWDFILKSRHIFHELKKRKDLDKIELALKTMYLRYNSLNGNAHSFISHPTNIVDFNTIKQRIIETHKRLKDVSIENRDYKIIIDMFNKKKNLFYLDPPYFGTDNTGYSSGELNLKEFVDTLNSIKGYFIMSHTEMSLFDDMFYKVIIGKRTNSNYLTSSNQNVDVKMINEVIYTNFKVVKENKLF